MAEDEDGVSNKKSSQNSNNDAISEENEQSNPKPDLGIEEAKYNSNENEDISSVEAKSSSSKSSSATRKEENPFSFRHFLKRDLSLPSNSTYESTGARPKVYANTVQHSPNKTDIVSEARRGKSRPESSQTKNKDKLKIRNKDGTVHQLSDNTSSSSSIEVPFSVVDNSESKHNLFIDNSDTDFYQRPNLASEPLGMPSLPDFVQDHILVEQAYLNSNGPISVDLDNLPDFTFNTNFNAGSSSSLGRRNNSREYRNYDYDMYGASTSESGPSRRSVPLDLPEGAESGAPPLPLDLPPHLNLDLTESVNPADRRNNSPRSTFPLDLPGTETMRLPDFLPPQRARDSPPPEPIELQQVLQDLERTRSELFAERSRRSRLESELATARAAAAALRGELATARRRPRSPGPQDDRASRSPEPDTTVSALRNQIRQLQEELSVARSESVSLRGQQSRAARDLRHASGVAETSLRELLSGLEQLKSLSTTLDAP